MRRDLSAGPSRVRGVAFVLVLWVIAMLSVLLGSFAMIARTENLQSRHLFDSTQARYAAEAGLNLAVYEMRKSDPLQRWQADGRSYLFNFGDAQVDVRITDDAGKIDVNVADPAILKQLFMSIGVDEEKSDALADAIVDWRDPDDLVSLHGAEESDYRAAGLSYGPRNAPFEIVSELQQVLGMNYAIYSALEPAITIYSGRGSPSAAYAPLEALMALPGMTREYAQQLIQARQTAAPGSQQQLTLPDGTPIVADGGGLTYDVKTRATLTNGATTMLDATVRMGGTGVAGRPFAILRWRDGESS
ncbi:MAG: type II secretion system protein GspK [Dokdonella sp.]